jgi:hypothetical protein
MISKVLRRSEDGTRSCAIWRGPKRGLNWYYIGDGVTVDFAVSYSYTGGLALAVPGSMCWRLGGGKVYARCISLAVGRHP